MNSENSNTINPLISVVIPCYNSAKYLERLLKSLINQTYTNWEAIFVDNYSVDNSLEIISSISDSRIKVYQINNSGIIAKSRNLGINKSLGSWIAFLDSDDWWTENKLEECVKHIKRVDCDFIYHDLFLVNNSDQIKFRSLAKSRKLISPIYSDLIFNGNGILNSSVVVKKSILVDAGMLTENIDKITWEDFDCWIKISLVTDKFIYLRKCLGYYWAAGGNMSNPERDLLNAKAIYSSYLSDKILIKPSWLIFSEGKALVKIGKIREGIKIFNQVTLANYSIKKVIKSKLLILKSIWGTI